MTTNFLRRWSRKLHRWGAILIAIPLLLVIVSGILLQLKKQIGWVQPATKSGSVSGVQPILGWSDILEAASDQKFAAAEINTWKDIDRLDVRPSSGIVKVRAANGYELQLDLATADALSFEYRRSDWVESLHDGSFFGYIAKMWIFLPSGLLLLGLWITGIYLWFLPLIVKRRKRLKRTKAGD